MTPLIRYTLVQMPGWFIIACLLWWFVQSDWITFGTAAWLMAIWVIKDAALYPLCRIAFEAGPATEPRALVGRIAEVVNALTPDGQVRLSGERWLARTRQQATIDAGTRVMVIDTDGMVLIVEPVEQAAFDCVSE